MSIDLSNILYVYIKNPKHTLNLIKGVFKPLKCKFRFSTKDWYPILWVSNPSYIQIYCRDVLWKDKDDTPRFENHPCIWIHIFKLNFIWYWEASEEYWEQALWYLYYNNRISYGMLERPNIQRAKQSWPWQDMNGNNTWTDKYLVNYEN